ncbi:MAG: PHP domain-containing protein [Clostridia bacterium]|nr:PHP domain-containing protein [Clostridia bacterium]
MKIYLIPKNGNFYKANLHSHTTLSDGQWTPEEMKEQYKAQGYSILAYTDHQVFINHNDLADDNFLPLNGYEIDITEDKPWGTTTKTCHFCLIALDRERTLQKIYHDSIYIDKNADKVDIDKTRAPIKRVYDHKFISLLMQEARNDRFFVTYNHPVWSLESNGDYLNYHGMHAMEIVNNGSYVTGHEEHNSILFDNMLHNGEDIYCIATDDNHNVCSIDSPNCDSFGGFTMIKADKLEYGTITKALIDGSFYASEGPSIYDLYYDSDDELFHIKTSDAVRIVMSGGKRYNNAVTPNKKGETITEASFNIGMLGDGYVRFTVRDKNGKEAYTNAYNVSKILSKIKNNG